MTRIQKAFKLADEGLSLSQAMLKAGYAAAYAKNPQKIKKTDNWQKMLAEKLPDDDLLVAHRNALSATKWNEFSGEREPDHAIRLRAAVEGYKLKGKMVENGGNIGQQVNISFDGSGYIPPDNVFNIKPTNVKKLTKTIKT